MSVDKVYEALQGLQHDAYKRREYNDWLEQFQRSPEAWGVTGEVLHNSLAPRELKIFCAQTLRNKAAYDLHQVPEDARLLLKAQVIDLLEINRDMLSVVGIHLCVALASFAMQMLEWSDPVSEMIAKLDRPDMVPLLFEFLKVLPEEFHSKRSGLVNQAVVLDRSTKLIQNNSYAVMEFILNRAELMAQDSETKALFFAALNPWLSEVQLDDIIASPLVPWMLSSFEDEDARAPAVDCLIIVLKETSDIYEVNVQNAVQKMYPDIMKLAIATIPRIGDDPEIHRELTRLLSEAALAWHVLISKDPSNFFPLLEAVAQCTLLDGTELTVLESTFPFFQRLNLMIGEPLPTDNVPDLASGSLRSSTPFTSESRAPFKPLFIQLLARFVSYLELPTSFADQEAEEIFRDFRYEIGNMLKVCSGIAGYEDVLQWFLSSLTKQCVADEGSASATEALLFGIRSIARTIPSREDVWLPKVFDCLFQLPFLDTEAVQHAAIMLLGRYSQWATFHPEYMRAFLDQIIRSAWSPFVEVRQASAHAFLYFCSDAANELTSCLPQILEFYHSLASRANECELNSYLNYSDGVGYVLNSLSRQEMRQAVSVIFELVTERCNTSLKTGTAGPTAILDLCHSIQGLGNVISQVDIFKSENEIDLNHPLYVAVMSHNALFTQVMREVGTQHTFVAESVAKYYIKVLFNLTGSFQPDLQLLLTAVCEVLGVNPLLPVLYELSSTISQCYSAYVAPNPAVDQVIWMFLQQTCSVLFNPEVSQLIEKDQEKGSEDSPIIQLVFQGFHLLCDVAVYFPTLFLSNLFEKSMDLSAHVLRFCYDQDSLTAVSHFYDDIKSLLNGSDPSLVELIKTGVEHSGMNFLRSLFYWFMVKPDSYFETRAEAMVDFVFYMFPQHSLEWLNTILSELPKGSTNEQEVTQFLGQVFQDVTNPLARGTGKDMNRFAQAYAARNYDPRL